LQLPHAQFINMLEYKGKLVGIRVRTQEESYTSKASFLDLDPIPTYCAKQKQTHVFSRKRISRSWYQAQDGRKIHADINGSYNILRKSISESPQMRPGVAGRQLPQNGLPFERRKPDLPARYHLRAFNRFTSHWTKPLAITHWFEYRWHRFLE
jgi:transposase